MMRRAISTTAATSMAVGGTKEGNTPFPPQEGSKLPTATSSSIGPIPSDFYMTFRRRYLHTGGSNPFANNAGTFRIGDVEMPLHYGKNPEKIPDLSPWSVKYFPQNSTTLSYLRWMMQKDLLKQDMCLIGEPGPARRWLALMFCHYAQREAQTLTLTRDTTEADIKQRKEIRNGSLCYLDQAAVSAALKGHILIIDGLERAERNVLPVINNLLENREMHLDNGMMLIHPDRYDQLAAQHGTNDLSHLGLLRVSEKFRVIGLTVPVPKFPGNPLDPPLRSRFQCLYLHKSSSDNSVWSAIKSSPSADQIMKFKAVLTAHDEGGQDRDRARKFTDVSDLEAILMAAQHREFSNEALGHIVNRIYPAMLHCLQGNKAELPEKMAEMEKLLHQYGAKPPAALRSTLESLEKLPGAAGSIGHLAKATFSCGKVTSVPCGEGKLVPSFSEFATKAEELFPRAMTFTNTHWNIFHGMMQSHALGRNMCLVGDSGCGKTAIIREFCQSLGYHCETLHLYADMSARDLLQRRTTNPKNGDTAWEPSILIRAVKNGSVAILDGIDNLAPGSLAVLQELLVDGNITLLDGTTFKREAEYNQLKAELGEDDEGMARMNVFMVHPSFRCVATSRLPTTEHGKKFWLTSDVSGLFDYHVFADFSAGELTLVLTSELEKVPGDSDVFALVRTLVNLSKDLLLLNKQDSKMPVLTLRQMLRVGRYVRKFPSECYDAVCSALLLSLMSPIAAGQVQKVLAKHGLRSGAGGSPSSSGRTSPTAKAKGFFSRMMSNDDMDASAASRSSSVSSSAASSGPSAAVYVAENENGRKAFVNKTTEEVVMSIDREYTNKELALVPTSFNYYPNRVHEELIGWLAKVYASGNKVLMVGNQGVGKNKIVDYFLSQAGIPRHYVQLHRDTTVSSLSINPSVIDGKVIWEDSPLVKAVINGHTLVVDEVDKAPVEVVQILKGLIEDREMSLGDGRRISDWETGDNIISLHPDFRMIVLANPPGFPFHGNNFYRECGDLFSCLVVSNPDSNSQLDVLTKYAPSVPRVLIAQLVQVFQELGTLFEQGAIQYPFSLRELINVVKHLQGFPQDGLYNALNNVFNFDAMDTHTLNHVRRLLDLHVRKNAAFVRSNLAPESELVAAETGIEFSAGGVAGASSSTAPAGDGTGLDNALGLELNVEFTTFARQELKEFEHLMESFPMEAKQNTTGVFSEVTGAIDYLPFLGAHDKPLNVVVLPRRLITFLVETDHPEEPSHFRLVSMADPSVNIGGGECPVPGGRVVSVMLPSTIKSSKNLHLLGALHGGGSHDCIVFDASTGDIYQIDVVSGHTSVSNFFSREQLAEAKISEENPLLAVNITNSATGNSVGKSEHQTFGVCIPGTNTLHLFYFDTVLRVTIPSVIENMSMFTPQLVNLQLAAPIGSAVMKIIVMTGSARCLLYKLVTADEENKMVLDNKDGYFVGANRAGPGGVGSLGPLSGEDMSNAVYVSRGASGNNSAMSIGLVRGASGQQGGSKMVMDTFTLPANVQISPTATTSFHSGSNQLVSHDATSGKLTVVNTQTKTARSFSVGGATRSSPLVHVGPKGHGVMYDSGSKSLRTFDVDNQRLKSEFRKWSSVMNGSGEDIGTSSAKTNGDLDMEYSKPRKKPSGDLKHGKEDEENNPHVGGNTWAGGTGGTDTAGLGGLVGPYRLDKGHKVHRVSPEDKAKVPKEIQDEARAMGKRALAKRLKEISMSSREDAMYQQVRQVIDGPIVQMQMMLNGLKAKEGERVWLKHQTDGIWDDAKIVEGITGEKAIYKRRSDNDPNKDAFFQHKKKKRLLFVMDVSASMYHFNGYDNRLNRLIESTLMIMESFVGHEDKIDYAIVGHSGDSDNIPFVKFGNPPANKKDRIDICLRMVAHSQHTWSGDNTVNAMRRSIKTVTAEDGDSYFVFVVSDANLRKYHISPSTLHRIMVSDDRVNMYSMFIADSFDDTMDRLVHELPSGKGFACMNTTDLPLIMKRIFVSANLLS